MDRTYHALLAHLAQAGTALGLLAAGAGLVAGLWLLVAPASFVQLEHRFSRTLSLRRVLRPLEIPRNLDRHLYRHHAGLGLLIIAIGSFTLYQLMFVVDPSRHHPAFTGLLPEELGEALFGSLQLILILGQLFAIVIGLQLYLRPSALKGIEHTANRWVSSRKKSRWLNTPYTLPSRLLESHPRLLGLAVLLLSLYLASLLLLP